MRIIGGILLKALSVFYLIMAGVGLLGYFGVERYSASIFSFFDNFMGKYTLILPIICLIFAGICWQLSHPKDADTKEEQDIGQRSRAVPPPTRRKPSREEFDKRLAQNSHKERVVGFSSYFDGDFTIFDPDLLQEERFEKIGTNFSTYFGQGKKNIYLPAKAVDVNGFRDYFQEKRRPLKEYDQAANDTFPIFHSCPAQVRNSSAFQKSSHDVQCDEFQNDNLRISTHFREREQERNREREREIERVDTQERENTQPNESSKRKPKKWTLPSLDLLHPEQRTILDREPQQPQVLEDVLSSFGVTAKVTHISTGPVTTRYELSPAPGTKISKIVNLADDIALALASRDIRIEAPIPGKAAVGIEIPRKNPQTVYFREVLSSSEFEKNKSKLKVVLGKDIANISVIGELEKMPHLLVAGATGSGKSIFINCLINSLLYTATPDEVRLLLIDPKMVELNLYNGIPHLLTPVVTDPKKANTYLRFIVKEMENRYELFASSGVRDIDHYNKTGDQAKLPAIVVIIDELADLMMVASNEIEETICRLAQMARAAGIHLVIATQRPSVNVITGLIKANIPSRISFAVSSQIDSRTILDAGGAEKLLGKGDMLYAPIGLNKSQRVHGCFIDEQEVKSVIAHWKNQGKAEYEIEQAEVEAITTVSLQEDERDERFLEAGELVITTGVASASFLQRRLRVGYSRAARLMDMLEEVGVVSRSDGNKPREILMSIDEYQEQYGT